MKYIVTLRDRTYEVEVEEGEAMILDEYEVKAPAAAAPAVAAASVAAAAAAPAAAAPVAVGGGTPVTAPMPGNIVSINVELGDTVVSGQVVAVMEAMKMNVDVVADADGTVKQIIAGKGAVVATGDTILTI